MRVVLSCIGYLPSSDADTVVVDLRDRRFWIGGESRQVSPLAHRWLSLLLASAPGTLTYDEMIDLLWGDQEDGGPDSPNNVLRVLQYRYRSVMKWIGIDVRRERDGLIEIVCVARSGAGDVAPRASRAVARSAAPIIRPPRPPELAHDWCQHVSRDGVRFWRCRPMQSAIAS